MHAHRRDLFFIFIPLQRLNVPQVVLRLHFGIGFYTILTIIDTLMWLNKWRIGGNIRTFENLAKYGSLHIFIALFRKANVYALSAQTQHVS